MTPVRSVLVVYGTTEGHTAKVAHAIASTLRMQGVRADVAGARDAARPQHYTGVVVAASVHAGRYQRSVCRWVRQHAAVLNDMPTAFVSVSLAVLQGEPAVQREVAATAERLFTTTRWYPTVTTHVAGALLYTRYGWLKRRIMRRIVSKAHGDTDIRRDFEYTDWAQLRVFANRFAERVAERVPPNLLTQPWSRDWVA